MIDGFYSEVDEHSGYKGGTLLQTIKLGLDSLLLKKKKTTTISQIWMSTYTWTVQFSVKE